MSEFEFADRPEAWSRNTSPNGLGAALMATLENGKAVVLPGKKQGRLGLYQYIRGKGGQLRTRTVNGVLHAWVERREPANGQPPA